MEAHVMGVAGHCLVRVLEYLGHSCEVLLRHETGIPITTTYGRVFRDSISHCGGHLDEQELKFTCPKNVLKRMEVPTSGVGELCESG